MTTCTPAVATAPVPQRMAPRCWLLFEPGTKLGAGGVEPAAAPAASGPVDGSGVGVSSGVKAEPFHTRPPLGVAWAAASAAAWEPVRSVIVGLGQAAFGPALVP